MNVRRIGSLALPVAALLGFIALPAMAGGAASLNDGRIHGFSGCLTQEPGDPHYFDLANAKTDDGKTLGTVRLTGSVVGITPKKSLDQQVHIEGLYLGHAKVDPAGGHVGVKDASVAGGRCSA